MTTATSRLSADLSPQLLESVLVDIGSESTDPTAALRPGTDPSDAGSIRMELEMELDIELEMELDMELALELELVIKLEVDTTLRPTKLERESENFLSIFTYDRKASLHKECSKEW